MSSGKLSSFEASLQQLEVWVASHQGVLPKPTGDSTEEKCLATWLKNLIPLFKAGKIAEEHLQRLKLIPSLSARIDSWGQLKPSDQLDPFDEALQRLDAWAAHHDGALPKQNADLPEERSLAQWLSVQGQRFRSGKMGIEQQAKLKQISALSARIEFWQEGKAAPKGGARRQKGPPGGSDHVWSSNCCELKKWVEAHDGRLPRKRDEEGGARKLWNWLNTQLPRFLQQGLSKEREQQIRRIPGMQGWMQRWDNRIPLDLRWGAKCAELRVWLADHGGVFPERGSSDAMEDKLANWVILSHRHITKGRIFGENALLLLEVPGLEEWVANRRARLGPGNPVYFDDAVARLRAFIHDHDGSLPSRHAWSSDEQELSRFVNSSLKRYARGNLTHTHLEQLQGIPSLRLADRLSGAGKGIKKFNFAGNLAALKTWVAANGGQLPTGSKREDAEGKRLASFLGAMQQRHMKQLMTSDELNQLLEIPATWDRIDRWLGREVDHAGAVAFKKRRLSTPAKPVPRSAQNRQDAMAPTENLSANAHCANTNYSVVHDEQLISCGESESSSSTESTSASDYEAIPRTGTEVVKREERLSFSKVRAGNLECLSQQDAPFMHECGSLLNNILTLEEGRTLCFRYLLMKQKALRWWPAVAFEYFHSCEAALCNAEDKLSFLRQQVQSLVEAMYLKGSFGAPKLLMDGFEQHRSADCSEVGRARQCEDTVDVDSVEIIDIECVSGSSQNAASSAHPLPMFSADELAKLLTVAQRKGKLEQGVSHLVRMCRDGLNHNSRAVLRGPLVEALRRFPGTEQYMF